MTPSLSNLVFWYSMRGNPMGVYCNPAGIDKWWLWRCSTKQMFPAIPVVTWIFKEHSATQALLFSNCVVAAYIPSCNCKKMMKPCGDQLFSLAASNNKASYLNYLITIRKEQFSRRNESTIKYWNSNSEKNKS